MPERWRTGARTLLAELTETPGARQRLASFDFKSLLILSALFAVTWLLWDTPLVYPIKIFVVMLHELGHAVAALLTGGKVVGIQIFLE